MSFDQILMALERLDAALLTVSGVLDDPERVETAEDVIARFTGNALLQQMVDECADRLGVDLCALTILGGETQHVLTASATLASTRREDSYCQFVAATGEPLAIPDNRRRPAFLVDVPAYADIGAYLGVPVLSQGQQMGSLCAIHSIPRQWSANDQRLLDAYSTQMTAVLEESRL